MDRRSDWRPYPAVTLLKGWLACMSVTAVMVAAALWTGLRLGVWVPQPRYVSELEGLRDGEVGPWVRQRRLPYLLREVFRVHDGDDRFVNVSDGGHHDNSGLLELIKRRCVEIWYIDGTQLRERTCDLESDGKVAEFGIKAGAIERMFEIAAGEYGVTFPHNTFEEQMKDLVSGKPGAPTKVIGDIEFVYPSLSTGEPEQAAVIHLVRCAIPANATALGLGWVGDARLRYPSFPNESTVDQFFTTEEYGYYVRLGRELCAAALP